jgi:hypothetical protein
MSLSVKGWKTWAVALIAIFSLGAGVASAQTPPGVIFACKENKTGILSAVPNQLIATTTCPSGTTRLSWNSAVVSQVVELTSEATAINDIVDLAPSGPSPGDVYVFSDRLYAKNAPTQQIGTADGHCTLIDPSVARFTCTIISSLPDGKITTEGTLSLVPGSTSTGAVTGGTGAYRMVGGDGTLLLATGQPGDRHQITLNLLVLP